MRPHIRRLLESAGFSPRQIFAALQGAWLEPTPGYIWQENTGVTPTTTGGQTIGKIADQSGWGNNATQSTAANRPLLGRRYNLLTYSEQFATSPWIPQGGGTLTATNNAGIAPNGSGTATALTPTTTDSNVHRLNYNTTTGFFVTGLQYVFSVYLKKNGYDAVIVSNDSPSVSSIVNLSAGTATNGAAITNVGNDWYRVSLPSFTAGSNVNLRINVFNSVANASGLVSYAGDGTSGIYIWGADLRLTADVGKDPTYQRITTATDYDYGQYPAAVFDTTDSLSVSLPSINVRRNLLTYSEQFDNAAWGKGGLNAFGGGSVVNTAATTDPNGGYTADYMQEDTSNGLHRVYISIASVAGTSYTWSIYAKAAQRSWVVLDASDTLNRLTWFNLTNGTVGTVDATRTASIQSVGNGWFRCTVSGSIASGTTAYLQAYISTGNNVSSYTGDGTSGIYIWGAQLELGSTATDYQRITDWTSEAYSSNGSVYFATPVGMSQLNNQSMGTTYTLPALSTDIYSWIIVPQRLSAVLESRLERYMLRKANLTEPDYLLDDDGNQLMSDDYELLLRQ